MWRERQGGFLISWGCSSAGDSKTEGRGGGRDVAAEEDFSEYLQWALKTLHVVLRHGNYLGTTKTNLMNKKIYEVPIFLKWLEIISVSFFFFF